MSRKVLLLAAAAASGFIAPAANAATAKHHPVKHRAVAKAHDSSAELRSEIAALKAEVAALHDAVSTQQQAQVTQQAQVAQTQTQVAAQQEQTQVASTKADQAMALATKTETAEAKTEKNVSAMSWAGQTKISGRMYFNFSNVNQSASGQKTTGSGTGFDIKRLYVGIDHKFNDIFAFNVTTDVSNVVGSTSNYDYATTSSFGSPVGRGFFIKKAYFEAKIDPALIIRAGSADMPWIANDENIYGYRHIENTIIDGPFGTSADWGIHLLGNLGKHFDYQLAAVNGAGYRNIKVSKNVDFEGRIGTNWNGFFADIGGYIGRRGNAIEGTQLYHIARRLDAMGGFKNDKFTLGAEYFFAKDWNNVATVAQDSAKGYTIFGNYNITKKWSVFGEHQWVQPNVWTNANLRQNYFNVGIQYEPVKIVDIALVYKRDAVNNGNFATNNGSYGSTFTTGIGCGATVTQPCDGTYDEVGIFGQIRF
ncbi:hypothetical protein [Novosphingobium terrae]|uniref:hypothetical protein n=1 Tax=Novosphingobium terrae TaxID=2726189 RepID=UPI00197FD378|nr:hypothetical protein [Novosphingobium terrae]